MGYLVVGNIALEISRSQMHSCFRLSIFPGSFWGYDCSNCVSSFQILARKAGEQVVTPSTIDFLLNRL